MAIQAHRNGDLRLCGAATVVTGQSSVYVNGRLWAVDNDPNSHEEGNLAANATGTVMIEGKPVVVHTPDLGKMIDLLGHDIYLVQTAEGSGDVFAY